MSDSKKPNHLLEKVISSVEVFAGHFLKVKRDQVELSTGHSSHREYIEHPGAAMIIPILADGRVLCLQQYRHPLKKIFLEFPAGKKDKGEDPLATAHRELREETGYSAKEMIWLTTIHPVIGYSDELIEIYLARDLTSGKQHLDVGEQVEIASYSLDDLMKMVREHKITDVKTQIGIFWLQQILNGSWKVDNSNGRV